MESCPCDVIVLWCVPKIGTNDNPVTTWDECLNTEQRLTQVGQTVASLRATVNAGGGFGNSLDYGSHPKENKTWLKTWRVLDEQRFSLAPGGTKKLNRRIIYNKVMTKYFLTNTVSQNIPNCTLFPIFIVRGAPIGVTTAVGTPATEITYNRTKLGVIESQEHHFFPIKMSQFDTTRFYNGVIYNASEVITQIDEQDNVVVEEEQ